MPTVEVKKTVKAPFAEVWNAVCDIEAYPKFMANVRSVQITHTNGNERTSTWSTILKGSILEWTEREVLDQSTGTIQFNQLDGDLDLFDGHWSVVDRAKSVEVSLSIEFEIGIPLLADMLNPVASRALRENSETMLREIERRVRAA